MKKLSVLVAVLALSAIGASNAYAGEEGEFTSTESAALEGTATATQVFTTNAGTVECEALTATGNAKAGGVTSQEATIHYEECEAFFSDVHISEATYDFTANGTVHLTNTVTITVTNLFGDCTVTVPPQTLSGITYSNTGTGGINITPHVTGIHYIEEDGFPCTSSSPVTRTNGTYTGDSHVFATSGTLTHHT